MTGKSGLDTLVEFLRHITSHELAQHSCRVSCKLTVSCKRLQLSILSPTAVGKGSLVLVREADSTRHRDKRGRKLQHDLYTGPWTVTEVSQRGLSVQGKMQRGILRSGRVGTSELKPFHLRSTPSETFNCRRMHADCAAASVLPGISFPAYLASQLTPRAQPRAPLSTREGMRILPIGFTFQKEMTRQELERCLH